MDDNEKLHQLEEFLKDNPELGFSIEEYKIKLDLKNKIFELPSKGTKLEIPKIAETYSEKVLQDKKSMNNFIKSSDFNLDELKQTQIEFLNELKKSMSESTENEEQTKLRVEELQKYIDLIESKPEVFEQIISTALTNDLEGLASLAEQFEIDPLLLINLGVTLIQPLMEELGSHVKTEFWDGWWRQECPVCGRKTIVGKLNERKRYFLCNFCQTEYLVDMFICNHCDNNDSNELAYYSIEGVNHLELDFCKKCSHYVKIIDIAKAPEPIPSGLEDIFTYQLDYIAKEQDLIREL